MSNPRKTKILYAVLFISILVLFFTGGGLYVTVTEDRVQPVSSQILMMGGVILTSFLSLLFCSYSLMRSSSNSGSGVTAGTEYRKHFVFSVFYFIALTVITVVMLNTAASFFAAPWPLSGLHGVSSKVGEKAWLYHEKQPDFVKANSWGQRDHEHAVVPQPGAYRVVFIGDSFLENGAPVPLPTRMEANHKKSGSGSIEIINLGISASDPDEYFFRLKNIGLPLKPDHCIMMFSAGTDFIQEPTLLSYWGISATYPRSSFLQLLGLNSLDQVISNERRQVLRAWFKGGSLLKHELELQEIFGKTADDNATEREYLSFFPPEEQAHLKSVLEKAPPADRSRFFSMLRHPDAGVFRSYYLDIATKVAKGMKAPESAPADYSFRWVKAVAGLCRSNGVKLTLVLIPDGFTVDSRMAGQYAAVADMKEYMKHKDKASDRFVSLAAEAGMEVIDLRELLKGEPGAYLNMDGHWSQQGVDAVAAFLGRKISFGDTGSRAGR